MLGPREIEEKALEKEVHRIIGEIQLNQYGVFFKNYNNRLQILNAKLPNTNNVRTAIVGLENNILEEVSLVQLVKSNDNLLSNILASLGAVCEELSLLCNEAIEDYYLDFTFYGEGLVKDNKGAPQISKLMNKLQRACFFLDRCQQVIVLLLQQICGIVGTKSYVGSATSSFPELLDYLAELLVCLITLDIVCESTLKNDWTAYRKRIREMFRNPSRYGVSLDELRLLEKCLSEIGLKVLDGNILQLTLAKCVNERLITTTKNSNLINEFKLYMQHMLTELERDDDNISFTQLWLQINAMFVFNYICFGSKDEKIYKRLLEINKKISTCTIIGHMLWHPEKFLIKHIPTLADNLDMKTASNNRLLLIVARTQNLPKESYLLITEAYTWISEITTAVNKDLSKLKVRHLEFYSNLLVKGIKIVKKMGEIVKWMTNVHAVEGRPMAKSVLLALCRLVEVLKAIQCVFDKNVVQLIYIVSLISQHLTHKALTMLIQIKKSFTQEKSYKSQQLNVLSALSVAEHALKGTNTRRRILVARLALSSSGASYETLNELRSVLTRLEIICSVNSLIHKLCNCSFLYWHQVLLPVYFSKLVDARIDFSRFYLFANSLNDCIDIMGTRVEDSVGGYLKNNMLLPLNQLVETNLRLQTHLHLQLVPTDPFQSRSVNSFRHLLPVQFSEKYLHIKEEVEHYLSGMFYNLTTVVLHDWRIYGEMRKLALLQYGLNTVEDNLPTQTLEQGIDVLEIMRNIHIFVGKYLYNLNNQVFVEDKSNNKHLNTISISHVANSIRTHGIGIMNTTVNFTYQFLQNQFYIFSQFLFDEQIKSRLLKDIRFFVEHKNELNQMYSYDRAKKFNLEIKKLGLNAEGLSFLDLFRKLITHIGNAMGYIRLIRSGGRRCLSDATCFLPDLKVVDQLKRNLELKNLSEMTRKTIEYLIHDVNNLVENFEEATEYFKLLTNVFTSVFRNPENVHLKTFYIIIPPLTINFIEHLLISKEKLSKKNRNGAAFTDDGFAMGLAFIVELLNQNTQLSSLNWFQSVQAKHLNDKKDLQKQMTVASKEDDKLQQTLTLTEKRLDAFEKEYQLLFYNFNSARIFFQS